MVDCKLKAECRLGVLGYQGICLSGNSAENIKKSQVYNANFIVEDIPCLGLNQYDVMIIGDQPSLSDKNKDLIFQDSAGEVIIEFLEKANILLNRVYMTKMVKCYAPKNKRSSVSEKNKCRDLYLKEEIKLIQPKIIMLIGSDSLRAFNLIGQGSINNIRGRVFELKLPDWKESPTFKIIPTLNPNVFHYKPNPKLKARVASDYHKVKAILDEKSIKEYYTPNWKLIDTIDKLKEMVKEIKQTKLFAFDTETCALNPRKGPLICFSFAWGWENKCTVLPWFKHDPNAPKEQQFHLLDSFGSKNKNEVIKLLKEIFEDSFISKGAHNFKFDMHQLLYHFGIKIKGFAFDTMLMRHLLNEHPPMDLEYLCELEFGWGDYSKFVKNIVGHGRKLKNTYDKVPNKILWPYACTDAEGVFRLMSVYYKELQNKSNLWDVYLEESEPGIRSLLKAEYKGMLLDQNIMDSLYKEYQKDQEGALIRMKADTWPEFECTNDEVTKALKDKGFEAELVDEKNVSGYSANKKILNEIKDKCPLAVDVLTYRNRQKMISTYLINAKNDLDFDGRIRYSWKQHGTVTGRLSCTLLHQVPKIDENRYNKGLPVMRQMFIAPEGSSFVYGDFSQVELWTAALHANDVEMLTILASGGDIHRITAYEFLKNVWRGPLSIETISKFNRTEVGKRIGFGFIYASQGYSLVENGKWQDWNGIERSFTWDMINGGMANWKRRFSGIGKFIDVTPDIVRSWGGIARNVYGRERRFGVLLTSPNNRERREAERECVNFFIQSFAGALTIRTINLIDKILDNLIEEGKIKEGDICLVNTTHDSLMYEVKNYLVDWFKELLQNVASRKIEQLKNHQFKLDVGVGNNWAEAEMNAN